MRYEDHDNLFLLQFVLLKRAYDLQYAGAQPPFSLHHILFVEDTRLLVPGNSQFDAFEKGNEFTVEYIARRLNELELVVHNDPTPLEIYKIRLIGGREIAELFMILKVMVQVDQ
jgi:hypothetical protein